VAPGSARERSERELGEDSFPVRRTSKRQLAQVDFKFEDRETRALEQNPDTKSREAVLARSGSKVMQFLFAGRYVANVVDRKIHLYREAYRASLRLNV
jgi:hypothetical protein